MVLIVLSEWVVRPVNPYLAPLENEKVKWAKSTGLAACASKSIPCHLRAARPWEPCYLAMYVPTPGSRMSVLAHSMWRLTWIR